MLARLARNAPAHVHNAPAHVRSARSFCLDAEIGLQRSLLTKQLVKQRRERDPEPLYSGAVARVSTLTLRPGAAEALAETYMANGRALYSACDGFKGAILLTDAHQRTARSVTLWESADAMNEAAKRPGYADTMAALASHFVLTPSDRANVEVWNVAAFFTDAGDHEAAPTTTDSTDADLRPSDLG